MTADTNQNKTRSEFDQLSFAVIRSVKYHEYRQRHFKFWIDLFTFLNIVLGMLTVYLFAHSQSLELILGSFTALKFAPGIAIAIVSSLMLVFRLSDKAQLHTSIRVDFQKLAVDLRNLDVENRVDATTVSEGSKRRTEIEVNEPPVLRVLDVRCHNETNQAMGYDHGYRRIRWYQKPFAKYFDLGPIKFEEIKAS